MNLVKLRHNIRIHGIYILICYILTACGGGSSADSSRPEGSENRSPSINNVYASYTVQENQIKAFVVEASDPDNDSILYSLGDSGDNLMFTISTSGVINFKDIPDYELPKDTNSDNNYELSVSVSDGNLVASKSFTVSVANDLSDDPFGLSNLSIAVNENTRDIPIDVLTITGVIDENSLTVRPNAFKACDRKRTTTHSLSGIILEDLTFNDGDVVEMDAEQVQIARGVTVKFNSGSTLKGNFASIEFREGKFIAEGEKDSLVCIFDTHIEGESAALSFPGTLSLKFVYYEGGSIAHPQHNGPHANYSFDNAFFYNANNRYQGSRTSDFYSSVTFNMKESIVYNSNGFLMSPNSNSVASITRSVFAFNDSNVFNSIGWGRFYDNFHIFCRSGTVILENNAFISKNDSEENKIYAFAGLGGSGSSSWCEDGIQSTGDYFGVTDISNGSIDSQIIEKTSNLDAANVIISSPRSKVIKESFPQFHSPIIYSQQSKEFSFSMPPDYESLPDKKLYYEVAYQKDGQNFKEILEIEIEDVED